MRDLTLCEERNTKVQRKDEIGEIMRIIGTTNSALYGKPGYLVVDLNYVMPFPVCLPYDKISEWEVLEKD